MAVVFRRGPSKSVRTMLWDRKRDTFRMGQWFRGRIYERRADLSPDGKFLICFAMNGRPNTETGGSWTAISRTPWLKAIVLLAKGDCWHGGGLFTRDCYWDEHELVQNEKGAVLQHPDWEWADRDGDSVVWGSGGCLYRARINRSHGIGTPKLLHDFNEMKFEAIPAPY